MAVAESLNFTHILQSVSGVYHCQETDLWLFFSESVFGAGSTHYAKRTVAYFKQPWCLSNVCRVCLQQMLAEQ